MLNHVLRQGLKNQEMRSTYWAGRRFIFVMAKTCTVHASCLLNPYILIHLGTYYISRHMKTFKILFLEYVLI